MRVVQKHMRAVHISRHRGDKVNELLGNVSRVPQWTMYTVIFPLIILSQHLYSPVYNLRFIISAFGAPM